jgi:hypothetical protein
MGVVAMQTLPNHVRSAAGADAPMKRLELWRWRYFDGIRGHAVTTCYELSADNAIAQWPDAERVPGTLKVLDVPEALVDFGNFVVQETEAPKAD